MSPGLSCMEALARRIASELQPYCTRLEIAGSIRRRCPICNDIDMVAIPKDQASFRARVLKNSTPIQDGTKNLLARLANGVQLDIFIAHPGIPDLLASTPSNYGSILLCRTGSREHNIRLVERAKSLGLRWVPYEGVYHGSELIASETEEAIFEALNLPYIHPEARR